MKKTTLNFSAMLRCGAMVAAFGIGLCASAQTFLYEGVVYKASGNKLTAQKATVKPENGEAPGSYTGDIVVPLNITYNGKEYVVISVAGVFKGEPITSIDIAAGIPTISRGCFQDCVELVRAKLPDDLEELKGDLFSGCVKLEELTIPGKIDEISSNQLKNCRSLKKLVFAEGPTPIEISADMYGAYSKENGGGLESMTALTEVVINRAIGNKFTAMDKKPFRNSATIETVTFGGSLTDIPTSYFEGATALKNVNFEGNVTGMGTHVFAGSGLEEITLPNSITTISSSTFQGCEKLKKVTIGNAVTSIQDMAFYKSGLEEIALPATLTSIGQMAFSGTKLTGVLTLPEGLKTIGIQAFAENEGFTEVNLPAGISTIGDGAFFGCPKIAKYSIGEGAETFAVSADGATLIADEGKTILCYAPASKPTTLSGDYEKIAPYAAKDAKNLTEINLPACQNWGDFAVSGTSIKSLTVRGTVGRYVAAECPELTELTVSGTEVPYGIALNDSALMTANLDEKLAVVKQDAFKNCTSLESLDLGSILAIIEAEAFEGSGLKNITVRAANPAAMADSVFYESMGITVTVPLDLVDTYKNAGGWSTLEIVGDANLASCVSEMGMPNGLYYAGTDGKLHVVYADGESDEYEVGGVPHTFQLGQFKNRIYGASAGQKFTYSNTGEVDGDGKLFYISKVAGQTFQAVVFDNTGNNAYEDPFGIYIYGDTLYVNDRNVCIRKIHPDAIAITPTVGRWIENGWLGFMGSPWSYGCIKCGWAITQGTDDAGQPEPVYWVGMKYNGNGLFRFRNKHIGSATKDGTKPEDGIFLNKITPIYTTFNIDEKNGHLYLYIETAGRNDTHVAGGLYRVNLADLEANRDPSNFFDLKPVLIDGAPVKYEGSGINEHVGISQLSIDENGEYMYWCYRAATQADVDAVANGTEGRYSWAEELNPENPLHQTGIKRIKLGEENPTVEMVAPGAEGYGVVAVKYEGSKKKQDGVSKVVVNKANSLVYANGALTVSEDATVTVYNMSGLIVAYATLAAGESMNVENLEAGVYVATAGTAVVKFVK